MMSLVRGGPAGLVDDLLDFSSERARWNFGQFGCHPSAVAEMIAPLQLRAQAGDWTCAHST